MSNLLDTQISESHLPILCIVGGPEFLQRQIIQDNSKKFQIVLIAHKKPDFLEEHPQAYFISHQNIALLPKLHETFNYSIVFPTVAIQKYTGPLLDKIRVDKTQTLLLVDVENLEEQIVYIKNFLELATVRLSIYGEVLDEELSLEARTLSRIIENSILNGEIRPAGAEAFPVYGISSQDFLNSISRLLLGNFKNSSIYYLFYKQPETVLESAHLINRVEQEVKIHFSDTSSSTPLLTRRDLSKIADRLHLEEAYLIEGASHFEKLIAKFFANKEMLLEKMAERHRKKKHKKNKKPSKLTKVIGFGFASLFFGTFLFIFINLIFLGASMLLLQNSIQSIKNGDFQRTAQQTRVANVLLSIINPTAEMAFDLINVIDSGKNIQKTFMIAQRSSELSELVGTTISSISQSPKFSEKSLTSIVSTFSFLFQEGQRISLETKNQDLGKQLKGTYSKLLSFSEIMPIVLGFERQKNYLLLFQNDEELRPTGGFIGSIGDLTVSKGKIAELTVQDVYELDGQLRNHIEPSPIIRRYLQPHLYLRDSNFSLNFQESASSAALLYNLETTKRPDAVIAINLEVLRRVIKATGPVELPSYNVVVTEDTVAQFLQSTIKENFFPGSTQKKDVLNALLTEIVRRSTEDPKFNGKIIQLLPDLLEEKNIQISFSDSSLQKLFSANGYGGENLRSIHNDSRTINDYLYINEANIGVNKVNAYISRDVSYNAMVGQGRLSSKVKIGFTNTSPSDNYKTYLRLAVPKGSVISGIYIDGKKQQISQAVLDFKVYEATDFEAPDGLEVEQSQKDNTTIFAFIVTANKGIRTVIDVEYENGAAKALQTIARYSLKYIKQSGTKPYNLTTSIDYPEGYTPVDTSADSYGKNFMQEKNTINKDYMVEIELQRRQ